jgi:DNA-binding response OmpR family regulator
MAVRSRIAIVDDEVDLAEAYAEYLADLGHEVMTLPSAAALDDLLAQQTVDLVILDLNMPGERGLDALQRLTERGIGPILILTGMGDPIERVVGLELGADDFVVKPVEPRELAARAIGLLSRYGRADRELVAFEDATVDLTASCLLRDGRPPQRLAPGEVMLVRTFASRPNLVLSRTELMRLAPAEARDAGDKAIDSRVARLRAKLETAAIVTVRGRGYMFVPPHQSSDYTVSG